ncbi:MAG TPA: putative molybdenum carrier protein [Nitrosospira sp.]|nr:putative molybdenum carrier protein [Nitrosospira sp.]
MIRKIVSGGQTGVDRAALDWAIEHDIPHGGWCPAGRRAEDGLIPARYCLQETPGHNYEQRTRWNVRDSDATLIVSLSPELTGGSRATRQWAKKMERPCLHVYPGDGWREQLALFFEETSVRILNVAGPRGSGAPGVERFVHEVLNALDILEKAGETAKPAGTLPRSAQRLSRPSQ